MANKWEGSSKPTIINITVPEVKKIKQPSKYYVYKLIVEWSNGHVETIYRRYSQFFDFQSKLLENFESTQDINGLLPELPGKILFGRSQVHQVAEKRRGKIEEFCQAVYKLPPAISESSVVQGFFSIWPEDTSSSNNISCGGPELMSPSDSFGSFSGLSSPTATLGHEYEMWTNTTLPLNEELLQYRATENYTKKDSQQVNLTEGQTVSVIERFDTGWWMVLAGDEQGYAPASLLEPIDESSAADDDTFNDREGLYEAVGEYKAVNQDEISIKQGETVQVINRSMDGWWEISTGEKTGFVPGSVMRRSSTLRLLSSMPSASQLYCKDVKFNPPPRRNRAGKTSDGLYDIPRKDNLAVKQITPCSSSDEDESGAVYAIPRPSTNSDILDGPPDADSVKTLDSSSEHTHVTTPTKDRRSPPHQKNGHVQSVKKIPLIPRKVITKSGSDNEEPFKSIVRGRSQTTIEDLSGLNGGKPLDYEDYIQMEPTSGASPEPRDIFATGPRRKKKPTPSKPLPYSRRQNSTNDSSISPLLRRMSRSHSFDNILDIGSPSEWAVNSDRVESPKPPRRIVLGSVIRANTNASNNSKATAKNTNFSNDDQTDAYVELQSRIVTIETFTAVEGYVAQSDICLSFNTGDCCALLRKTDKNWWLVNIGGREGWVPGSFWTASSHVTASKFASPPLFPAPERQEKSTDETIYTNQAVCKRPLMHTKSTPIAPEKPRKAPPKPKLPADLAADIRSSRKFQSPNTEDIVPTAPSRYASLHSTSSRGSTPDPDIIPISTPSRNSNEYENSFNSIDYENTNDILTSSSSSQEMQRSSSSYGRNTPTTPGHDHKPAVPSRVRSETSIVFAPERPSVKHRNRADTVGDALTSSPTSKPRSMTVASFPAPQKKHDYEEINDEIEQQAWFFGRMNREDTETLLKEHGRQCEFLIRERSNKNGFYALSIRHHMSVRHFNIDPDPSGISYTMGAMKFESIQNVIKYYQENSLFLNNGVAVKLGQPVRRRSRVESSGRKS